MDSKEKVLKNINYKTDHSKQMANNRALRKNSNDECYTPMKDIADELSHWGDKLTGKRIICPWIDIPNVDRHTHTQKDGTIKNEFAGILVRRKKIV